ncbi:MAG: hypothetical protein HYT07_00835 [Candidatus Levybacteria bacterium]|nr:hypothetical protein [Candidatus Levybacteria bacterium]
MSVIRFDYTPEVFINPKTQKVDYIYRPLVDVRLSYKHNFGKNIISCLLDSGADKNLFPASWGESVGINIKKGESVRHYGIGANDLIAYRHKVMLYIGSFSFEAYSDFSFEQSFPLLGREGFFKYFKEIVFNEKGRFVNLKY